MWPSDISSSVHIGLRQNIHHLQFTAVAVAGIVADVAEPKMSETVAEKVNINNEQQAISFKLASPHTFKF